jgi:hypothetical protein
MSIDRNDTFLIRAIHNKNYYQYDKFQKKLVIADMKGLFIFTYKPYLFYVRTPVNKEIMIQIAPNKDFLNTLKNLVMGSDDKSIISFRTIFKSGLPTGNIKNIFRVDNVSFDTPNLSVLYLFQGYPLESNCPINMNIIQTFLDHIMNIIWGHDIDIYFYFINWISCLIQKNGSNTETALIIIREQGIRSC